MKKTTIYLIRHCKAEGQEPEAALTEQGKQDAKALVQMLRDIEVDHILASPYKRAVDTIMPLAEKLNLGIQRIEGLKERVLSNQPMDDWLVKLEQTFVDKDIAFEGGESSREALSRVLQVIEVVLDNEEMNQVVLVSHGNLLSLLINHYNPAFGFQEWAKMRNPDLFILELEGNNARIIHHREVNKNPVL